MTYHVRVREFHAKFGLPHDANGSPPRLLDASTWEFRYRFLHEELRELAEAHNAGDLAGFADALVDLIYVASGTAHLAGLRLDDHFDEVHRANLTKERATGADDGRSKRGHALDVVKPPGWRAPDHAPILRRAGWEG
jgi:predicted HAD superfamily Cof-like phosphohydrolase